jgi:hypothetical protein
MGTPMIYNADLTEYEAEYLSRIYEPYVYLMTQERQVTIDFKGGETITLFKTPEGAVRYFNKLSISVEEYYGDPNPHVHFVKVATPGKYTAVDITINLHANNSVYGTFFRNPKPHPTYGDYIGWAYTEPGMVCDICGGDTTQVDMEYLSGTYHIDCLLAQHA